MDERELLRAGRDRWRKEGCLIHLAEDKPAVFIGHPRDREATERECTGGATIGYFVEMAKPPLSSRMST